MTRQTKATPIAALAAAVATGLFLLTPAGAPTANAVTEYFTNPVATNPAAQH